MQIIASFQTSIVLLINTIQLAVLNFWFLFFSYVGPGVILVDKVSIIRHSRFWILSRFVIFKSHVLIAAGRLLLKQSTFWNILVKSSFIKIVILHSCSITSFTSRSGRLTKIWLKLTTAIVHIYSIQTIIKYKCKLNLQTVDTPTFQKWQNLPFAWQ